MLKIAVFIVVLAVMPVAARAQSQSQYQYQADKLTEEQQHLLEVVKQEKQKQAQRKKLDHYRDKARNPEKYRAGRTYNTEKNAHR